MPDDERQEPDEESNSVETEPLLDGQTMQKGGSHNDGESEDNSYTRVT
jgi:hypothetical protein